MKRTTLAIIATLVALILIDSLSFAATGRVVDTDGKPIPNAEVSFLKWTEQGPEMKRTLTGSDGSFSSTDPSVQVLVLADGYSWGRGWFGPSNSDNEITITLYKEQKLTGKVVDEQGQPLPGATVTIERTMQYDGTGKHLGFNFYAPGWQISETESHKDGTFTLSHLSNQEDTPYGDVVISASMKGRATITKTIQQSKLSDEVEIILPRECALAGVIYLPDKSGTAPEGFPIVIRPVDGDWASNRQFTLGKDGRFLVSQLAPGKYRLTTGPNFVSGTRREKDGPLVLYAPEQPDWVLSAADVSIVANEAKVIELVASCGVLITGKVLSLDDNKPVPNAAVCAVHSGRPEGTAPTCSITDEKGEFTLRAAEGNVKLDISSVMTPDGYIHTFQPADNPSVSFNVVDGEEKSDVCLMIKGIDEPGSDDQSDDSQTLAKSLREKPAIQGLSLKAGSYEMKWDPEVDLYHGMTWGTDSRKDEEIRKLMINTPSLGSEKARFVAFTFDGDNTSGLLLAILDESHGTGTGFDTVYFDRNRNADLSDDEPVKLPRLGSFRYAYSKWADVVLHQGEPGERRAYKANVRLEYYKNPNQEIIYLQRKGAWHGSIDSNKGPLDCVLTSGFNMSSTYGRHTSRVDIYGSGFGDTIYIDTNGYGRAVVSHNTPQTVQLDVPAKVASKYYYIDTSKSGDKVTIKPYDGKLGTFKITSSGISGFEAKPVDIGFYNDHGEYDFDLNAGPVELPVGTYKVHHVTFDLENVSGENTTMICVTHDPIVIESGKVTSIDISGDISLELAPRARYISLDAGTANGINLRAKIGDKVTVAVIGKMLYSAMGCCSMGEYFRTGYSAENCFYPHVELFDKDDKLVFSGKADAGNNNPWLSPSCGVTLPAIEPGVYKLQLTVNSKTSLGKLTATKDAIVRDPAYGVLASEYDKAIDVGDKNKAEQIKTELLEKCFTWKINFGKPYEVTYRNYGRYPTKDKLSAVVTWYDEKDAVKVVADVTDAYFATDPFEGRFYRASSIQFYFAPSGSGNHNNGIAVIPRGDNGVPEVQTSVEGVKAHYKRTEHGYHVEISVPWKSLDGYSDGWKLMPVGIMLNARTGKDRTQLQLTQSTEVFYDPRGYPAIVAP